MRKKIDFVNNRLQNDKYSYENLYIASIFVKDGKCCREIYFETSADNIYVYQFHKDIFIVGRNSY